MASCTSQFAPVITGDGTKMKEGFFGSGNVLIGHRYLKIGIVCFFTIILECDERSKYVKVSQ